MNVQEGSLVVHNLLSRSLVGHGDEWFEEGERLRQLALDGGVYPDGPLLVTIQAVKDQPGFNKYTVYLPLSDPVETKDRSLHVQKLLHVVRALWIRHFEAERPFEQSYQHIRDYAEENGLSLEEPFYHLCLEAGGDVFFDIYAPIKGV